MNKLMYFITISLLITASCEESGPCRILENGVYRYPDLPVNKRRSHQEIQESIRLLELPDDVNNCISTGGLLETCLRYPEWKILLPDPPGPQSYWLFKFNSSPQEWFENSFRVNFNGIRELESRSDYPSRLVQKYIDFQVLDYQPDWDENRKWRHLLYIAQMEVMLSQYKNLKKLEKDEKKALVEEAQTNVLNKGKVKVFCIDKGQSYSMALIARLMYVDEFAPILELYDENTNVRKLVDRLDLAKPSTLKIVYDLTDSYLIQLQTY